MTWSICFPRLSLDSNELGELLSFLNPDEVLVEFLEAGSPALDGNLRRLVQNKFSFVKAVGGLQSLSFVKVGDCGKKISIHRLVQSVIREGLTPEIRLKRQKDVLCISERSFQSFSLETLNGDSRARYRRFLPQIIASLSAFEEEVYQLFALSSLSESLAAFLFEERQYFACQVLNQKILDVRRHKLGPDDPNTLRILRGLALTYTKCALEMDTLTRSQHAIRLYEQALEGQLRVLGPSHPDTLWTKHSLAVSYNRVGRFAESGVMFENNFHERSRVLGVTHIHTLRSKFWLALRYEQLGQSQEARKLLEETVVDTSRNLGETHADTLRVMDCLASNYIRMGSFVQAKVMLERGLASRRLAFGENHPYTQRTKTAYQMLDSWNGPGTSSAKFVPQYLCISGYE
jgi:tetratricopeptide (TPR) repeat protein